MAATNCPGAEVFERLAAGEVVEPAVTAHIQDCSACQSALSQARDDASFLTRVRTLAGPTLAPEGAPRIPGYGSLRLISTGAQGMVYKAVQESTSRPVAIKVMNRGEGVSSRQQHRAEREAEIAARLRHPNIVTVFESRTLGNGRIAVVMEFISGVAIDTWAGTIAPQAGSGGPPGQPRRVLLRAFISVCNAIHHAHMNGVIHRDLKPDNILVTEEREPPDHEHGTSSLYLSVASAGPRPVVLDFGIAKAGGIQATITGDFAGTPAYASPEQVAGKPEGVDGLTDVYSLGVILYRLVCGTLPYTVEGSIFEIARTISEAEPTPPRDHDPSIPPDLVAIIMRALRKEKEARYQSAAALAHDIERLLKGDPVEARAGSGWYLLRKAVSVNRNRLAAVGVGALVIAAAVTAILLTLSHAAAVAKNARQQHEQALAESTRARAVTELLRSAMPNDDPAHPELTSAVGSGLGRLYVRLETGAFADDPDLDQTLRRLWGGVYTGFGSGKAAAMVEYAEVSLRNGLVRLRAQPQPEEAKIAATLHQLAGVLLVRKRSAEAEAACREAISIRERLSTPSEAPAVGGDSPPAPVPAPDDVADSHALLARILLAEGRPADATREADAALAIYRASPEREVELSIAAMTALKGRVCLDAREGERAEPLIKDGLVRRIRRLPPHDPELLASLSDAADLVELRPDCALATLLASAWQVKASAAPGAIRADLSRLGGPDTNFYSTLRTGRAGALSCLIRLQDSVLESGDTAIVSMLLELVHSADGDMALRTRAAMRAADLLAARFGPNDFSVLMCVEEASTLAAFAGEEDQATALIRRAISIWEAVPEKARDPLLFGLERRYLGWYLSLGGHYDEAIGELNGAIEQLTAAVGAEHHTVALAESNLAYCLAQRGDLGAADTLSLRAMTLVQSLGTVPLDAAAHIRFVRGHVLHLMGRHEPARALFEDAWNTVYQSQLGTAFPWRRVLVEDISLDCEALGDQGAALKWRGELKPPTP